MANKNLQKEFDDLSLIEQVLVLEIKWKEWDIILQTLMEEPYDLWMEVLFRKWYFEKAWIPWGLTITKKLVNLRDYINNK